MERKSLLALLVLLLVSGSVFAKRISRKEELAALKLAYKEAIARTESLSKELSAQVEQLDSMNSLVARVNSMQKENSELREELKRLEMQAKESKKEKAGEIPVALFFEIGKTSIGAKEVVNLTFYVENCLKLNPDKLFTVYGVGTSSDNTLAEKRVEYICDLLHKKYGIEKSSIKNGGIIGKDTYPNVNLNRVVIIQ